MVVYVGLADLHGIEYFMPKAKIEKGRLGMLYFRAISNRHRHALVYEVSLTEPQAKKINDMVWKKKDFIGALKYMKKVAKNVKIARGMEKSWNIIPNPKLDPWR